MLSQPTFAPTTVQVMCDVFIRGCNCIYHTDWLMIYPNFTTRHVYIKLSCCGRIFDSTDSIVILLKFPFSCQLPTLHNSEVWCCAIHDPVLCLLHFLLSFSSFIIFTVVSPNVFPFWSITQCIPHGWAEKFPPVDHLRRVIGAWSKFKK